MKYFYPLLFLTSALFATEIQAQEQSEEKVEAPIKTGWFVKDDGISVHHSGIILPFKLGKLNALSNEAPKSGRNGMDNIIQYRKANSDVFASIYIYKPSFVDAELTAKMTNNAINTSFAVDGPPDIYKTSPIAGIENSAIVMGYKKTGKRLATAAGFAEIGSWIIKIRVSGPENEFDKVMSVMSDALSTIKISDDASAQTLSLNQPKNCTIGIKGKAKIPKISESKALENSLLSGLIAQIGAEIVADEKENEDVEERERISFSNWCIADSFAIENINYNIYRTVDEENSTTIMPFSDTGNVFHTSNMLLSKDRNLSVYNIGSISNYGVIKGDLSAKQYSQILSGQSKLKLQKKSENIIKANGDTNITLFAG